MNLSRGRRAKAARGRGSSFLKPCTPNGWTLSPLQKYALNVKDPSGAYVSSVLARHLQVKGKCRHEAAEKHLFTQQTPVSKQDNILNIQVTL
ncbi:Dof zinc finger protein DOF1.7 [Frankliniella fusca]|uniref:Dof zinc finger protein DOF1.7 n=1 Tax=Frankliniella fusca TaxID=407009 RepID=A0AAE1LFX2_9NEOP|nr:Dof zinc finger protein DOF1.7 [Frankliniella fusca]